MTLDRDYQSESVVYGCIKNIAMLDSSEHRRSIRAVMLELPSAESWSLLNREMFAVPEKHCGDISLSTDVTHFGVSYQGVQHEWKYWLEQFENLLRKMYWVSATVHLEIELSGLHSFVFETDGMAHKPNESTINIRCEWARDVT
jgi:hypothetical protein